MKTDHRSKLTHQNEPTTPTNHTYSFHKNRGNTVGQNHGIMLSMVCSECKHQLQLARQLIEQQQAQLADKERTIQILLASQLPKP